MVEEIETHHEIIFGNTRDVLQRFPDDKFQLMVTSPPYWNVRDYGHKDQIGFGESLESYLNRLNEVWREVVRTLLPDGKIAVNIGNVYYSEDEEKRKATANLVHSVWKQLSGHGELRFMGTIYWQKTTSRDGAVLFGSYPYPTNFMVSSAVEAIHIFRKIGSRKPDKRRREMSKVTLEEFRSFRDAIWYINGVEDKHVAAFPYELPARLIKMFSFVGDTVIDPFLGSGTTMKAARDLCRNSVGVELNGEFLEIMKEKIVFNQNRMVTLAGGESLMTRGNFTAIPLERYPDRISADEEVRKYIGE